jgi:hypothetical protein
MAAVNAPDDRALPFQLRPLCRLPDIYRPPFPLMGMLGLTEEQQWVSCRSVGLVCCVVFSEVVCHDCKCWGRFPLLTTWSWIPEQVAFTIPYRE